MSLSRMLVGTVICSFAISPVIGSPNDQASAHEEFGGAQIRKDYGGKEDTPNHIMFGFLLRYIAMKYEADKQLALVIIQDNMRMGTYEGIDFLHRILATEASVAESMREIEQEELCQEISARPKAQIYQAMDLVDDERVRIERYAYTVFQEPLTDIERSNFNAWIHESKDGFRHVELDHASLYENDVIDVKTHLQQVCIKKAQAELKRADK